MQYTLLAHTAYISTAASLLSGFRKKGWYEEVELEYKAADFIYYWVINPLVFINKSW